MLPGHSPFVKIANIENFIEAQVLESVLKERDVPFRLRSFHDTAYDGLFQFQQGWGEIYAPAERKEEILEIIESVFAKNFLEFKTKKRIKSFYKRQQ